MVIVNESCTDEKTQRYCFSLIIKKEGKKVSKYKATYNSVEERRKSMEMFYGQELAGAKKIVYL
jgi:hypothetical protein